MYKIFKEAMKNRLSLVQQVSKDTFYYSRSSDTFGCIGQIRANAVNQISHAISERLSFEEEISDENTKRFFSRIFIFTQEELLSLISFIKENKDA